MDASRSRALLARLIEEATQSSYVYVYRWRAGDVIVWDNRAIMHRGRQWPGIIHVKIDPEAMTPTTTLTALRSAALTALRN